MSFDDNPPHRYADNALRWLLYGVVVALLLGRRLFVELLYAAAFAEIAIIHLKNSWRTLPTPLVVTTAMAIAFTVLGVLSDGIAGSAPDSVRSLLLFPIAALAAYLTASNPRGFWVGTRENTLLALLALFVTVHVIAGQFRPGDSGLFSNPHYLALYASISLPIYVLLLRTTDGWRRPLAAILLVINFAMLLQTHSRPAWLAVMLGAAVTLPFLSVRLRIVVSSALVAVPTALYWSNALQFRERVTALLTNLATEERVAIWSEAWLMQTQAPVASWYWGNGFAAFARDFKHYSSFHGVADFIFPHNFVLEILYASGLPVLIAVSAALFWLLLRLVQAIRRHKETETGTRALLLLSILTIHLSLTFLTVPFYSRYSLMPLSLMFGIALWLTRPAESIP
jgi:O-antigen ligase